MPLVLFYSLCYRLNLKNTDIFNVIHNSPEKSFPAPESPTFLVLGYFAGHLVSAGTSVSGISSASAVSGSGSIASTVFSISFCCEVTSISGEDGWISEHMLTVLCLRRCCPM